MEIKRVISDNAKQFNEFNYNQIFAVDIYNDITGTSFHDDHLKSGWIGSHVIWYQPPNGKAASVQWLRCSFKTVISLWHDDVIKWKHFPVTDPLYGEFTGRRWIPRTKASDVELWCFLWKSLGWLFEEPSRPLWRHCYLPHNYKLAFTLYAVHISFMKRKQ